MKPQVSNPKLKKLLNEKQETQAKLNSFEALGDYLETERKSMVFANKVRGAFVGFGCAECFLGFMGALSLGASIGLSAFGAGTAGLISLLSMNKPFKYEKKLKEVENNEMEKTSLKGNIIRKNSLIDEELYPVKWKSEKDKEYDASKKVLKFLKNKERKETEELHDISLKSKVAGIVTKVTGVATAVCSIGALLTNNLFNEFAANSGEYLFTSDLRAGLILGGATSLGICAYNLYKNAFREKDMQLAENNIEDLDNVIGIEESRADYYARTNEKMVEVETREREAYDFEKDRREAYDFEKE